MSRLSKILLPSDGVSALFQCTRCLRRFHFNSGDSVAVCQCGKRYRVLIEKGVEDA